VEGRTNPLWPRAGALWNGVRGAATRLGGAAVANRGFLLGCLAALAAFAMVWQPSFPLRVWWTLAPPDRSIFVDSPEVYSRERLINERLSEEAWLNDELASASTAENLSGRLFVQQEDVSARVRAPNLQGGGGEGGGAELPPAPSDAAPSGVVAMLASFDQEFKLRSSYRSLIRQRLIENKLDDRHDLEGNSLYILKFDTTVLSVPATGDRAVVRIRILPPAEIQGGDGRPAPGSWGLAGIEQTDRFSFLTDTYSEWMGNLEGRVNARISQLYEDFSAVRTSSFLQTELIEYLAGKLEANFPGLFQELRSPNASLQQRLDILRAQYRNEGLRREFQAFFALRAAAEVTGASLQDLSLGAQYQSSKAIPIVGLPFGDYIYPVVTLSDTFQFPPRVDFHPFTIIAVLTKGNCKNYFSANPDLTRDLVFRGNLTFEGEQYASYAYWSPDWSDSFTSSDASFNGAMTHAFSKFLTAGARQGNGWKITDRKAVLPAAAAEGFGDCEVYDAYFQAGLLSFAAKISSFNTYSYSVLPRESPIAVMNEILQTRSAMGEATGVAARRSTRESRRGLELKPALTTFGDIELASTDAAGSRQPIVGWVIDPSASTMGTAADFQPMAVSESVLAIISVPAWWSAIRLDVDKTWWGETTPILRRSGGGEAAANGSDGYTGFGSMSVRLPNRYELLDGLLIDDLRRSPVITGIDVSPDQPCGTLRVLVVGERLWRNTAVTIGSYKAARIEVLPNMEGILAEFAASDRPQISPDGRSELRVWTSEGVAELPRELASNLPALPKCDESGAAATP